MEITQAVLDDLKADIESSVPHWLKEVEAVPTFNSRNNAVEVCLYFNFLKTNWVKIRSNETADGPIDIHCNMRMDWTFVPGLLDNGNAPAVKMMFDQLFIDFSDLLLSAHTGHMNDPLLHYSDDAIFLPRDEVRKMIQSHPDTFAPRIDEYSTFKEEDWYKEWEASQLDAAPGV